jgi:hypothetical protein
VLAKGALTTFDASLPANPKVKIVTTKKGKGRICLTAGGAIRAAQHFGFDHRVSATLANDELAGHPERDRIAGPLHRGVLHDWHTGGPAPEGATALPAVEPLRTRDERRSQANVQRGRREFHGSVCLRHLGHGKKENIQVCRVPLLLRLQFAGGLFKSHLRPQDDKPWPPRRKWILDCVGPSSRRDRPLFASPRSNVFQLEYSAK